ncbi:MAG: ABC transporter ATP-binding protein [Nitrospirota bacterium]
MELLARLWPYVKKYLRITFLAIICTLVVSGTSGATAWLIKPILDDIFVKADTTKLAPLSFAVFAVYLIKNVFTYFQSYLTQYASFNIIKDIRNDLYTHMVYLPLKEYQATNTGRLISHVINDVGALSSLAGNLVKDTLQQSFSIVGLVVVLFMRDWKLATIAIIIMPLMGVLISKYGKKTRKLSRKSQESIAGIMSTLQESFTGSRIVKAFTMEDREDEKFMEEHERFTKLQIKNAKINSLLSPTLDLLGGLTMAIIIFYGGHKVTTHAMTPGGFFSFTAALFMLYGPVKTLGGLHNSLQSGISATERIFKVFDTANEKEAMSRGISGPEGIKDNIQYRGVSFKYNEKEDYVLKDVDLTIKKGEVVAVVGASGGGKTTLANLLPRFYELQEGAILIDGQDTRGFQLKTLRQNIAVVTQDTILFNDTIRNNIAYGKEEFTEEMVAAAARAAHADIFIDKLPKKYNTIIGEKGFRLSGGEKQRISIARAILKNSQILILDEATSSLDTESERIVQQALENLMKNRTTLVIAHRLSTIINADKIVVISGGKVTDIGKHSELLEKSRIYKRLYDMQFGKLKTENVETL